MLSSYARQMEGILGHSASLGSSPPLSRFRLLAPYRPSSMVLDSLFADPGFPMVSQYTVPMFSPLQRRDHTFEQMVRRRENEEFQKRRAWERLREQRIAQRMREEEERDERLRREEMMRLTLEKERRKNVENWWASRRGVYRIPIETTESIPETSIGTGKATEKEEDVELQQALQKIKEEEEDDAATISRMNERLALYGLKEIKVSGNGDCQFASISQNLYGTTARCDQVRKNIVAWLRANEGYVVDKGSTRLKDFLDTDEFTSWNDYCDYMAKSGVWGDHLTLIAAANVYNRNIVVISSVATPDGTDGVIFIEPRSPLLKENAAAAGARSPAPDKEPILLSHWHEIHYNALAKAEDTEL